MGVVGTAVQGPAARAKNVPLYEHFGYAVIGHVRVSERLETWSMYRRKA